MAGPTTRDIQTALAGVPYGRHYRRKAPDRIELFEQFLHLPKLNASIVPTNQNPTQAEMAVRFAANRNWEAQGEAGLADSDIVFNINGGILIQTPDSTPAANDFAGVTPHRDTAQSLWGLAGLWGSENEVHMEAIVRPGSLTAAAYLIGLKEDTTIPADLEVIGSDDNAAFWFLSDDGTLGSTYWQMVENVDGADTRADGGAASRVLAQTSADVRLEIRIDADRRPGYYLNGHLIRRGKALKDAVDLIPYVAVMTDTTAVKSIALRSVRMSRRIA